MLEFLHRWIRQQLCYIHISYLYTLCCKETRKCFGLGCHLGLRVVRVGRKTGRLWNLSGSCSNSYKYFLYKRQFRCRFKSADLQRTLLFASVQWWHWRKMMAINAQMSSDCIVCNIVSQYIWLYKVMKDEYIYEFKQDWKTWTENESLQWCQ